MPRILVAEDHPDLLELFAQALAHDGTEVVRAATGAELVLSLAQYGPFDVVITDINMPWMDGLEAMRTVRYAGVSPPVVFITGSADTTLDQRIAGLGSAVVLLRKPVRPDQLQSAVSRLLSDRASGDADGALGTQE
jgi:CheY-like chemotaxis protein